MSDQPEKTEPAGSDFRKDLASLINLHSRENGSNTPDFILAEFLVGCLASFDAAITVREAWYGRGPKPVSRETSSETPAVYTPAKPVVTESDPENWPKFPGEGMDYRGIDQKDEDIHAGGPR